MLLTQFQAEIAQLPPTQHQFLIGFSGGLDSTALLLLFAKLREKQPHFMLRAIHIHHGLSANADAWVTHCQQICQQVAIPLIVEQVKIDQHKGIEAGAREGRYQAIRQHLLPNEMFATAHHQQDQTETFFLALKRGSGLAGLGAMQRESTLYCLPLCRPLLTFTRQMLLDYVKQAGCPWVEDESNIDSRYERNFLRHEVLPRLRQRWPHFDNAVQRSAQHCFEQQQLLNELLHAEFAQHFDKTERTFQLRDFATRSQLKQNALLRLWLAQCGLSMPSKVQLTQLIQDVILAKSDSQPQFQLGEYCVRRYQDTLYLTPHFADLSSLRLPIHIGETLTLPDHLGTLSLQQQAGQLQVIWSHPQHCFTSILPLTEDPIEVRFRYSGKVRLSPTSANKDIKKLWQQHAVPVWLRQRIPLIFYADRFKSAVGYFNAI
ncbi:tRNA lysidine(34) synthetase TilS [Pasteurella multocida]|uniref:tRNA lysidine(34) synthetase TilS n=1 Tax=Pasteurella multocida TaxID=747 RepID=UPI00201FF543|nr:tRNA lysidine(34) synthetase TilS [Pasteurella multocida]MCL7817860.1 tRNA lysidine(34) synthetase TilS [Pasteurella multocida]MEB3456285.1 tRNA lysidine(34) synthetase TilS [Pasteurella multocida]MEB3488375.1 tRNA lysidine(34) synthetase TilS [Pasteurella multocida]MEB3489531.1 tRNA lysidine(34) synthetase TilS [Pasteurella multocida]WRK08323.1 tRNA lysidine(34) synthetase TilS [Pasteurella multocida]